MATAKTAKPASKSEVLNALATSTGLKRKEVNSVLEGLGALIQKSLGKKGPGMFVIPGLLKLKVIRKPAVPAREGINPFTKEPTIFKAKPARNVVKAVSLKRLKDMVK